MHLSPVSGWADFNLYLLVIHLIFLSFYICKELISFHTPKHFFFFSNVSQGLSLKIHVPCLGLSKFQLQTCKTKTNINKERKTMIWFWYGFIEKYSRFKTAKSWYILNLQIKYTCTCIERTQIHRKSILKSKIHSKSTIQNR